jgi:cell division protein FtsB
MSIKLLARDLYRCQREVEQLQKQLQALPSDKRDSIEAKLRKARSERDYLRQALDGRIGR